MAQENTLLCRSDLLAMRLHRNRAKKGRSGLSCMSVYIRSDGLEKQTTIDLIAAGPYSYFDEIYCTCCQGALALERGAMPKIHFLVRDPTTLHVLQQQGWWKVGHTAYADQPLLHMMVCTTGTGRPSHGVLAFARRDHRPAPFISRMSGGRMPFCAHRA